MQKTDIQAFYPNYSPAEKQKLTELQALIHEVADESAIEILESAKWGQLSFEALKGTPIRIDKFSDSQIGFFVHCQTNLIETWRSLFSDTLSFSKNRAILLDLDQPLPEEVLKICIDQAFNYHLK
ncbi:DUF1801 domain-containing protein [Enterococcus hulanensis]|uniref:DUF1801 domain-containing protein n=1 Tax=Enterococcus hulanensis TaxID=2559929 RepID=UPI0010F95417|nr:DUF1801 domain-containing protein [Enterococcus hulanensis]